MKIMKLILFVAIVLPLNGMDKVRTDELRRRLAAHPDRSPRTYTSNPQLPRYAAQQVTYALPKPAKLSRKSDARENLCIGAMGAVAFFTAMFFTWSSYAFKAGSLLP